VGSIYILFIYHQYCY